MEKSDMKEQSSKERNTQEKAKQIKGSYTLEAAVVLPLVAGFFVCILMFFRILQVQTVVQKSLIYASRKTAVMACMDNEWVDFASAEIIFRKDIGEQELIEKYVKDGRKGIYLIHSSVQDDEIILRADYRVQIPVGFFTIKGIEIRQTSASRKWIGDSSKEAVRKDTEWVYITPNGSVYHLTKSCTHLDLSVKSIPAVCIGTAKNKNGQRYRRCERCAQERAGYRQYFVTDYGTCYHTSLSCSGLKRTVYRVKKESVKDKRPCTRCGNSR